ncbi:MAG: Rha family transcriptional regulator [Clostridia bacterium]|nr:Rha family transcriptional regulator [Clostridia bacterium]
MKSDLVFEKKGFIYTSSTVIAEKSEIQHESVVRLISNNIDDIKTFGNIDFSDLKSGKRGRPSRVYYLNERQATLIMMYLDNTEPVKRFKKALVQAFFQMAEFIRALNTARLEFPELTSAILEVHETPKHYHFSNEMDMINRIVLGMTAKQYKEANCLGDVPSIRPYLTAEQLYLIGMLQKTDIGLVLTESDFQKRKQTLEWYCTRLKQKLLIA